MLKIFRSAGSKSPSFRKKVCKQIKIAAAMNIITIVTYGTILSDPVHYNPCTTASQMYRWSYALFITNIVSLGVSCLIIPLLMILSRQNELINETKKALKYMKLVRLVKLIMGIASLVCFAGLCYSYDLHENCQELESLVLSTIIITPIIIVLVFTLIMCKIMRKKKVKEMQKNNNHNGLSHIPSNSEVPMKSNGNMISA